MVALKNRVFPEFTVLNIYFLSFRIWNNLRLPCKTEFALKIFTVLKYFLSLTIFEQLDLALKTEFALKFSSRGGGRPPASYATAYQDPKSIIWKSMNPTHPSLPPNFHPRATFLEYSCYWVFSRRQSAKTGSKWLNGVRGKSSLIFSENCRKLSAANTQIGFFSKISNAKVYFYQVHWIPCCLPHPVMFSIVL